MDVRLPNGTIIKNVPEGTTKKQLLDKLAANGQDVAALTTPATPEESFGQQVLGSAASTADIIAESAPGMAAWAAYPLRRAASIVTGETPEDIQASLERVTGTVSAPVGRALGVAESPSYKNNMIRQALGYVGETMDVGANYLADTAVADALGLTKPDIVNMMQSGMSVVGIKAPVEVAGNAISKIPAAGVPGKVVRAVVSKAQDIADPRTKFYMDVAAGKAPELIAAARNPAAEIIPGSRPTFAQATAGVGVPQVAAVGEQAAKVRPVEALVRKDAQEAARVGELKKIERTPEKRKLAETVRERRAGPLYEEARAAGDVVDVAPTLDYIDGLIEQNPGNSQLQTELRRIRKGLVKPKTEKIIATDKNGKMTVQEKTVYEPRVNAEEISSSLDGIKAALANEDNAFIKKELTNIKDDLIAAIPSMKEAQAAFRKGSKPINQMDIGKYLREKLEAPLPEGAQRAGVFAQAVKDAPGTIKRALDGQPRYEKLTDVLSPAQQARVDAVLMDLSRDARVREMAQLGSESAPKLRKTVQGAEVPNMLNRVAMIANAIIRRLEGKINEKMAMDIALEFLDAGRAADAMETALKRAQARGRAPTRVLQANAPKPAPRRIRKLPQRAPVITAPNTMSEENRNRMAR